MVVQKKKDIQMENNKDKASKCKFTDVTSVVVFVFFVHLVC